jgi:selenocysteine lyase/cysteine desulfurase
MLRLLKVYGLQIATPPIRGRNALRISPHIYNTEEDILKCAEVIKEEIDKF